MPQALLTYMGWLVLVLVAYIKALAETPPFSKLFPSRYPEKNREVCLKYVLRKAQFGISYYNRDTLRFTTALNRIIHDLCIVPYLIAGIGQSVRFLALSWKCWNAKHTTKEKRFGKLSNKQTLNMTVNKNLVVV